MPLSWASLCRWVRGQPYNCKFDRPTLTVVNRHSLLATEDTAIVPPHRYEITAPSQKVRSAFFRALLHTWSFGCGPLRCSGRRHSPLSSRLSYYGQDVCLCACVRGLVAAALSRRAPQVRPYVNAETRIVTFA